MLISYIVYLTLYVYYDMLENTVGWREQTEDATINRAFWGLDKAVGK